MTAANDKYFVDGCHVCRNAREGVDVLSNFKARIKKELVYHDGKKHTTHYVLDGMLHNDETNEAGELIYPEGETLPETTVPASQFDSMGWVANQWGIRPVIYNVAGSDRDMKTAIQVASKPERVHIYQHTGWSEIDGKPYYLSQSGGIGPKGLDSSITVELPHELSRFSLPDPKKLGDQEAREAFMTSLRLINLTSNGTLWPLLLATYRACMGPADFALHVAGRTGTFKSEVASLFQSHYGEGLDARHLPASWNSTGNALEALAYRAKDALMVVDDFVPVGTAHQVRHLQKNADQLIRGQGNQAGRSRLTDMSSMQTTYYARGIILSTGEDVMEGHSVRGRMMILELVPGSIEPKKLTAAQNARPMYSKALACWIQWIAETNAYERMKAKAVEIRDMNLSKGHTRTPAIVGHLLATAMMMTEYNKDRGFIPEATMKGIEAHAWKAITDLADNQKQYIEAADPVKAVLDTIRLMLGSGIAHVKSPDGGVPSDGGKLGWTEVKKAGGGLSDWKSNGPRIGWIDEENGEFLLDANSLVLLKKYSGGKLAVTPQTLMKRMKEAGLITRCDDARQRMTVRRVLEGHRRQAICMNCDDVFDEGEDA